jgi:hypothetical protein
MHGNIVRANACIPGACCRLGSAFQPLSLLRTRWPFTCEAEAA